MARWRGCSLQGFGFPLQPWRRLQQGLGPLSQLGTWVTAPKTCEQVPRGPAARRDPAQAFWVPPKREAACLQSPACNRSQMAFPFQIGFVEKELFVF